MLDIHLSESARFILLMDTDVLFFRRPDEIFARCLGAATGLELTSFSDPFDWLSVVAPQDEFETCCQTRIEPAFNAGVVVIPRLGNEQFRFFERMLRCFKPAWRMHYFADQLLLALAAGEFGWHALPNSYRFGWEANLPDEVAVHYVSNKAVRPRFYIEGIPKLVRSIDRDAVARA